MKKYILFTLLALTSCFQASGAQGRYTEGSEESQFTNLHAAAQRGDLERVRALLADPSFSADDLDISGQKPLYYAQESLGIAKSQLTAMESELLNTTGKSAGFIALTERDRAKYAQEVQNLEAIIKLLSR